jgi:hypothetical protein
MLIRKAYVLNMTYNVPDNEKNKAERALLCFNHVVKELDAASEHLDIIKTPFKDNPEMKPEEVKKTRAAIRRFRDKSIDNFNSFKHVAFKCVNLMQYFSSDTQTVKLMKSFISSVDDLESKVNDFVDLFTNLESKSFAQDIVKSIEIIQKKCEEIENIIEDRIITHVQSNILATSWVDSVSNDLQMKIEKKTPLIQELFDKRQDALNKITENKG